MEYLPENFVGLRSLALAGASRSGKKFGNVVLRELTQKGYKLSLLHPQATGIDGRKCYPTVSELPEEVEGLIIVVPPAQTLKIVEQLAASTIKNVWMQQGSESAEAVEICRNNNINVIHGQCILMFAKPTGFHKFHRWMWALLGKLPKKSKSNKHT